MTTPPERPWLDVLMEALDQTVDTALDADDPETPHQGGAQSANSPLGTFGTPSLRDFREKDTLPPDATPPAEIAWRVAVFKTQIPPTGPIGYLHATPRTAAHDTPGHCGSCGEPREPTLRFCCHACAVAKEIALNATREELTQ